MGELMYEQCEASIAIVGGDSTVQYSTVHRIRWSESVVTPTNDQRPTADSAAPLARTVSHAEKEKGGDIMIVQVI